MAVFTAAIAHALAATGTTTSIAITRLFFLLLLLRLPLLLMRVKTRITMVRKHRGSRGSKGVGSPHAWPGAVGGRPLQINSGSPARPRSAGLDRRVVINGPVDVECNIPASKKLVYWRARILPGALGLID